MGIVVLMKHHEKKRKSNCPNPLAMHPMQKEEKKKTGRLLMH
jgi:hypothetical protein